MKLPKSFLPNKNLDKKTEQLIQGYKKYLNQSNNLKSILETMFKLNLSEGVLYTGLKPLEFKQNNLPYDKIIYAGIACARLGEKFYRYRFNYESKNLNVGLIWLEIVDTRPKSFLEEQDFKQLINHVKDYYPTPQSTRIKPNVYEFRLNKPQSKKDLMAAIENFYSSKFPYLGSEYNLFFTKIIYKGLTEEEFIKSNIALHHLDVNFKKYPILTKNLP